MKFFFRQATQKSSSSNRLYAIGDVHGHAEELDNIFQQISIDAANHPDAQIEIVLLGDLINRGPHSKSVIDSVIQFKEKLKTTLIKGNHEVALINFLDAQSDFYLQHHGAAFVRNGGITTLASYGFFFDKAQYYEQTEKIPSPLYSFAQYMTLGDCENARNYLLKNMPAEHIDLLRNSSVSYRYKPEEFLTGYFLCHGGVDTEKDLHHQDNDVLTGADYNQRHLSRRFAGYVGKAITDSDGTSWVVVHGHKIVGNKPVIATGRISVDTGCFDDGYLSCVVIADGQYDKTLRCKSLYPPYDLVELPQPTNWPPKTREQQNAENRFGGFMSFLARFHLAP